MRTALWVGAVMAVVALSGCGNACDHESRANDAANDKAKACGSNSSTFDADKCQSNLHSCSQDDIAKIDNFASCLDALPSCPASSQSSFDLARLGCLSDFQGISAACLATQ